MEALRTDVAIVGGGLGACAAALAAARLGRRVLVTEETRWLGGQLTSQAVPPDEHRWIEDLGATASYRALRTGIRDYYRAHLPLTAEARARDALNPGNGWVSRLCHDPRVALAVLHQMMIPHQLGGRLLVMPAHRPIAAWTHGDRITGVAVRGLESGRDVLIEAPFFIDATPYGDLLDLAGVEHVLGAESRAETGEPHALEQADPRAQQAITVCFAMEHLPGEDHTIDRPRQYALWRELRPPGWPGPLLSWTTVRPETHEPLTRFLFEAEDGHPWWHFRRILDRANFEHGFARSDVTVVNWPQHDYWFGPVVGVDPVERARNLDAARELSLSLLYWLQTEAPRPDGGVGYPGLHLRGLARHRVERAVCARALTRKEMIPEIERLDLLILGGGGILYDRDAEAYLREVVIASELGVPVFLYAISAGPLATQASRRAVQEALNASPSLVITVRDRLGYRLLEDVGVTREIHLTADPALLLEPAELSIDALTAEGVELDRPVVGFSVREPGPAAPEIRPEEYYALLANAADFIVERYDAEVLFVPMEKTDVQHSHAVVAHMRNAECAEILRRRYSPRQILDLMGRLEFAVGMRLHFLIFAALRGTPFAALPYASKVTGLLEDLEMAMPPLGSIGIGQLIARIDRSWDTRAEIRTKACERLSALRARARRTNELLLDLLEAHAPGTTGAARPPGAAAHH